MEYYHNLIVKKCWTFLVAAVTMSVLLFGCQSRPRYPSAFQAEPSPPSPVILAAGDEVEVKFFYTPQLNETQFVRPDGKIALQLVGEIEAQGKTPAELRKELMTLYSSHVKEDLEVSVIIRSFENRRVFVGGQVITPGIVEMPAKLTVLQAIMQAGGFNMQEAEIQNIVVIRHRENQRYGYSLDLKPTMKGGQTKPFYLQAQDIVYVPRTDIVKVGQWVDQHINRLVPQTGFLFSKRMGDTTIGIDTSSRY